MLRAGARGSADDNYFWPLINVRERPRGWVYGLCGLVEGVAQAAQDVGLSGRRPGVSVNREAVERVHTSMTARRTPALLLPDKSADPSACGLQPSSPRRTRSAVLFDRSTTVRCPCGSRARRCRMTFGPGVPARASWRCMYCWLSSLTVSQSSASPSLYLMLDW